MSTLSASDLLLIWERGQRASQPERALLLLGATPSGAQAGDLPVGQRDRLLLALRERLFGREMPCVTPCPQCGETLEFVLDTRQFHGPEGASTELHLEQDGYRVRFRVPTGSDLVACASEPSVEAAQTRLIRNCLMDIQHDAQAIEVAALPEAMLQAVASVMAEADPCADLQMQTTCPACSNRWWSTFDIVVYLWTELQDWAIRMLREVHTLASAYGWAERDILAMSAWRRRLYLQLVGR